MISNFISFLLYAEMFFFLFFQKISERAFDGLNNLQRLNLENNHLKLLERGIFTGVPALIYLNLMKNSLETITYNNILPLMDNLVNNTNSILDITGALNNYGIYGDDEFMTSFLLMCHNHQQILNCAAYAFSLLSHDFFHLFVVCVSKEKSSK
jgi:Leucine-rich repeat (LRR) protein